ncbi:hypothetical protein JCM10908_002428 [Rhodotorula pacifica]|uniref:RlpA-like double-psi beta-barrel domain-containing protein n=1 Tax=Rhodotorula pacifica TaxID=1495444 RepID=UPI00317A608F
MSTPPFSKSSPPRDQFASRSASNLSDAYSSDAKSAPARATSACASTASASRGDYAAASATRVSKTGGGPAVGDASLVKPSRKGPVDKSQGAYAPIGTAGEHDYSDHLDSSAPPSESDLDSEPVRKSTKKSASTRKAKTAKLAGGDVEKGEADQETGWSRTKKLVVGGLVLLAVLVIAVIAFLALHGSKSSSSSSAAESDSVLSRHGNSTDGSGVSNSTSSNTLMISLPAATASGAASGSGSLPGASGGTSGSSAASGAVHVSSNLDSATSHETSAGDSLVGAASATIHSASGAAVASAVSTGVPFTDSFLDTATFSGLHTQPIPAATPITDPLLPRPTGENASDGSNGVNDGDGMNSNGDNQDATARGGADDKAGEQHTTAKQPSPSTGTRPGSATAAGAAGAPGTTKMTSTATWFGASQHLSACHEVFDDTAMVAAVSPAFFGSDGSSVSELCDAKIHVWQADSDQTIALVIKDVCNDCPTATSIDLTQGAFLKLANSDDKDAALDAGVLSVQWWFDDAALQAKLPLGFEHWDTSE